jgi:hypothetical protein
MADIIVGFGFGLLGGALASGLGYINALRHSDGKEKFDAKRFCLTAVAGGVLAGAGTLVGIGTLDYTDVGFYATVTYLIESVYKQASA